jgi:hypothetical protein
MRLGGGLGRAAPAVGQMDRHPDRAANARIDANSIWSRWSDPRPRFFLEMLENRLRFPRAGSRYVRVLSDPPINQAIKQ